jgi:hypothetical protein
MQGLKWQKLNLQTLFLEVNIYSCVRKDRVPSESKIFSLKEDSEEKRIMPGTFSGR